MNVDFLIGVGQAAKILVDSASKRLGEKRVKWVSDESRVLGVLKPRLEKKSAVLVKGSRSIHLEKVVERLTK